MRSARASATALWTAPRWRPTAPRRRSRRPARPRGRGASGSSIPMSDNLGRHVLPQPTRSEEPETMPSPVRYEVDGQLQVATITLARPEKLNAMDRQTFAELGSAAATAAADARVRAVLVTGEGRAFSSGLDVAEFSRRADLDEAEAVVGELQRAISALERLPKPVVAAVNGLAVGGGLQLAIACDLRIASEDAQFAAMEMRWAIVPDLGGTERLPRLIGLGRAKELILTGPGARRRGRADRAGHQGGAGGAAGHRGGRPGRRPGGRPDAGPGTGQAGAQR